MKSRKIVFYALTVIALIFPVGFLLNLINMEVAILAMFTLMGVQQLYHGIHVVPEGKKKLKLLSYVYGVLMIIFGVFIVLPYYYF